MNIYVVGAWRGADVQWEMIGIFDDKALAVAACVKDEYFIGPKILNVASPDESEPWPGCWYPRLQAEPEARP